MSKKPQLYKFKDIENRLHTLGTNPLYELTVEHVIAVNASEFFSK